MPQKAAQKKLTDLDELNQHWVNKHFNERHQWVCGTVEFQNGSSKCTLSKAYDFNNEEKVPVIKKWSGREGFQIIQTLTNAEKETCTSATRLFNVLKEKFRPQHNAMILSLEY